MRKKQPSADNCLYFDITKQERDSAIRYLLGGIINTRKNGDFPSNYYTFDEDVNVYLAHLLFAISLPEYHEMAEPYLSLDTSDVLNWVRSTEDRTIRYFIFKVNADHILTRMALFDDLHSRAPKKLFRKSKKHYAELAKLYYDQAAAYHHRIYRKKTGVGDVLQKLSQYFDAYQELLNQVRRDYFKFLNQFRDQAFLQFMREVSDYESQFKKGSEMDQFLDLYGQWLETKNPNLLPQIESLVMRLQSADPGFRFDLDQLYGGGWDEKKCA